MSIAQTVMNMLAIRLPVRELSAKFRQLAGRELRRPRIRKGYIDRFTGPWNVRHIELVVD